MINKKVKIIRHSHADSVTIGLLFIDDKFFCYTLELPWRHNEQNVSCISPEQYIVEWNDNKDRYRLHNVLDRTGIDIHVGNFTRDTMGCILLGFGVIKDRLSKSQAAVDAFHKIMNKEKFILTIDYIETR